MTDAAPVTVPSAQPCQPEPIPYVMPPGRGRRPAHNAYVVTRELTPDDINALWAQPTSAQSAPSIKALRYGHHLLARLVAQGKSLHECSLATGLSVARISTLKADPTFSELVEFYAQELREIYVNVHERMASLGVSVLEELQDRFDAEPDKFTKRELMDLFVTVADRSIPSAKGGPAPQAQATPGGSALALQINFVTPPPVPEHGISQAPVKHQSGISQAPALLIEAQALPPEPSHVPEPAEGGAESLSDPIAQAKLNAPRRLDLESLRAMAQKPRVKLQRR